MSLNGGVVAWLQVIVTPGSLETDTSYLGNVYFNCGKLSETERGASKPIVQTIIKKMDELREERTSS